MSGTEIPLIRQTLPQDAAFLAWAILTASRSHLDRGWFDIALNQPADRCLEFLRKLSVTTILCWWHHSRFPRPTRIKGRAMAGCRPRRRGHIAPGDSEEDGPGIGAARGDGAVQVRDVASDGEGLSSARSLKRLGEPEAVREHQGRRGEGRPQDRISRTCSSATR